MREKESKRICLYADREEKSSFAAVQPLVTDKHWTKLLLTLVKGTDYQVYTCTLEVKITARWMGKKRRYMYL